MLTDKQEKFVQELIKGKSQREAYKAAYNSKAKDSTMDANACRILADSKVKARYEELKRGSIAKTQDDAESMRAFIIEQYKKIASGEICDVTQEMDAEGNILRQRRTVKAADVSNAITKLAEYYGVAPAEKVSNDITIKIEGCNEYDD